MLPQPKLTLTILAILPLLTHLPTAVASDKEAKTTTDMSTHASKQDNKLPDGLYRVHRSDCKAENLAPPKLSERLLRNDYHFLEPAERQPARYLVLQTSPFVPLTLGADPSEDTEEGSGKPRLQLQLTEDQIAPLEEFTRMCLGKTIAIVIDGEVVTTHQVKSVITGGRLQITRCTKRGCETLYTKLLKNRAKK